MCECLGPCFCVNMPFYNAAVVCGNPLRIGVREPTDITDTNYTIKTLNLPVPAHHRHQNAPITSPLEERGLLCSFVCLSCVNVLRFCVVVFVVVVMGISALFREPDHLVQLTNKSRLPNGSSYRHLYLTLPYLNTTLP